MDVFQLPTNYEISAARASLEDEYARKLLHLSRKSLGSHESGTLKTSLDTLRGEVEAMAKQHQGIAAQMKTELEEPLDAFAGGMKERRKIVQGTVEKLLKTKMQQTQQVNKVSMLSLNTAPFDLVCWHVLTLDNTDAR